MSSVYNREAALIKFQQNSGLKKTNTMTPPVKMPMWMEKSYKTLPLDEELWIISGC